MKKENNMIKPIEILLVEDNPADVRLTLETLKEDKIYFNHKVVSDGEEALNYLFKRGEFSDAVRPDLIILDLNLPKVDGKEVLKQIKEDASLKIIPVVVLTVSEADEDILKSYELHANCYITKPIDLSQFSKIARAISEFWFAVVKIPPEKK